ncbi:kinesin-like protein KIF16B [Centruroides vittatus]|uniref:kinesin-like protein KIF16B n=1 Tax=Centruroides vittatus TaxID=120091 RepID=UPI00350FF18A
MASVKVAVRVRPFNQRELEMNTSQIIKMEGKKTIITNVKISPGLADSEFGRTRLKEFTFDHSYWSFSSSDPHFASQQQVFQDLGQEVVESAFEGYNACIFAYGQTGSGKTYTMMGTPDSEGLIPRICQALFARMKTNRNIGATFRTEVSYLEIYNERVKDLLRKNTSQHNLRVREHPKLGPYVQDLSKHLVMDYSDVQELMTRGNSHRTTAATTMNDVSSRSHAIFTLTFSQANFNHDMPSETMSKVNLVDLAGSERADVTGATGQRLKEGGHINKSLVTLGTVISALADMSSTQTKKTIFIPYRDSVLTWLLKDSLGGNSKTIMIAAISPAECNYGETLSTLRYANRAKNIINKPTINEDPNVKLIRELRNEIAHLKSLLGDSINSSPMMIEKLHENEARVKVLTEEWTERWKETHKILKEQRTLGLRKSGQGVVLDSELPHLIGIDDDVLSTGITLYHLKEGTTYIGTENSSGKKDIVLNGVGIEDDHCIIELQDGKATLIPLGKSECFVNTILIDKPTRISQGCVILLGKTNMFRYNDPAEVERLRKEKERGSSLNLSRLSLLSRSASDLARSIENLNSPMQEIEYQKGKDWELLEKKRQHIEQLEKEHSQAEERRRREQLETEAKLEKKLRELEHIRKENEDICQKAQIAQKLALEEQAKLEQCCQNIEKQLKEYNEKEKNGALALEESKQELFRVQQKKEIIIKELENLVKLKNESLNSYPENQSINHLKQEVQELEDISKELDKFCIEGIETNQSELNEVFKLLSDSFQFANESSMSEIFCKVKENILSNKNAIREKIQKENEILRESRELLLAKANDVSSDLVEGQEYLHNKELLSQKKQNFEQIFGKKLEILEKLEKYFNKFPNSNRTKPVQKFCDGTNPENSFENSNMNNPSNCSKNPRTESTSVMQDEQLMDNRSLNGSTNDEWKNQTLMAKFVEDQFHMLQQELERRRKAFEEERLQELDHIEMERFHLQELEQQKRINCLVEQEVQRRLFEEKLRLEREYLKNDQKYFKSFQQHVESRFPNEATTTACTLNNHVRENGAVESIKFSIPSYTMRGSGSGAHYEYEVKIYVNADTWTIYRRYKRFRELHHYMRLKYGDKVELPYFPPRKIFGSKSERVVEERRNHLEVYLNKLILICMQVEGCPLHTRQNLCKQDIYDFAPFFHKGCFETSKHGTG